MATHRKAFTLVELLVVIGIIALLIAMLMPTLVKAREAAKSAACLSNLRQTVLGFLLYAHEHNGCIPLGRNKDANIVLWTSFLTAGLDAEDRPTGRVYVDRKVAICPSAMLYEFETSRLVSSPGYYGYAVYVANTGNSTPPFRTSEFQKTLTTVKGAITWKFHFQKLVKLPAPASTTVMLGDSRVGTPGAPQYGPGQPYTIGNFSDQGNAGYWQGRLHMAHAGPSVKAMVGPYNPQGTCVGRANVAFYDGHCQSMTGTELRAQTTQKIKSFWDRNWTDVSMP